MLHHLCRVAGGSQGCPLCFRDANHGQGCWRTFEGLEAQSTLLAAERLQDNIPRDTINPSAYFMSMMTKVMSGGHNMPISTPSIKDDPCFSALPGTIHMFRLNELQDSPPNDRRQPQYGKKVLPIQTHAAVNCNGNNPHCRLAQRWRCAAHARITGFFHGCSLGFRCGRSTPPEGQVLKAGTTR